MLIISIKYCFARNVIFLESRCVRSEKHVCHSDLYLGGDSRFNIFQRQSTTLNVIVTYRYGGMKA